MRTVAIAILVAKKLGHVYNKNSVFIITFVIPSLLIDIREFCVACYEIHNILVFSRVQLLMASGECLAVSHTATDKLQICTTG